MNDLATKYKQPEITKGYPIFEWSPGIPITYQAGDEQKTEDNEIASTHGNDKDFEITKNWEE